MERFKHVFELFKLDWIRIYKNKLTFVLIIALMAIPSLYAWFNIGALWDPYSNTGDIKIAVYSDDKTVDVMDKDVNIGDEIIGNLKDNDSLGWQFVDSKEDLDKGVKSGKYYAGVYLPSNFSDNLVSFVTKGEIKHPEIVYSVNQKINAIAPKISDKGAGTIQENISKEFITTVTKTLLEVFNEVGFDLDSNLPSIRKMTTKILEIDDNMDVIDGYTKEVVDLNNRMPEFKEKLNKANEFVDLIPEANKMSQKVLKINDKMPQIEETGKLVYTVQDKIPDIQNAGRQVNMIDQDFDKIVAMMDQAVTEAENGLGIISDAQKVLPKVSQLAKDANKMIPELKETLDEISKSLETVGPGIDAGLNILSVISGDVANLSANLATLIPDDDITEAQAEVIHSELVKLSSRLDKQSEILGRMIETLQLIQGDNSNRLEGVIERLSNAKTMVDTTNQKVQNILGNWESFVAAPGQLKESLLSISKDATTIKGIVDGINGEEIQAEVTILVKEAQDLLTSAGAITGSIVNDNLIKRIDQLLNNTSGTIEDAVSFLKKYQKELPAVKQEIHSANEVLNGNMPLIVGGINDGASFFRNDFPVLKDKLGMASGFIKNDLPGVEKDIQSTMKKVNDKAPELEKALATASSMIKEDWPNVRKSIHTASDKIRKGEEEFDLDEIIKFLKTDANSESDFISSPVKLKTNDVYPVPNYGSASTPFYTALCLWVGAVLFSSIASTKFHLDEEQEKRYSKRQQFLARMMTYVVVGVFQTLIVTLGNQFLLGTYTMNPVWNVIFALIIDVAFMVMVYVLVALFDNLGKGIAIIILVLSISAGGGNFPIEMSGPFFRAIHPYIPFTHAVNLLRESVGGVYWPTAIKAISILVSVTIAFFIAGYIIYPRAEKLFSKINENLKKGHILH
ncbi:MAG: YhgE/Pip family protein [Vagococcus sp.]